MLVCQLQLEHQGLIKGIESEMAGSLLQRGMKRWLSAWGVVTGEAGQEWGEVRK